MTEHVIRLRAAWQGTFARGEAVEMKRVDLPTLWPPGLIHPFRLERAFQTPPRAGPSTALFLRLERAPGLAGVRLNGLDLLTEAAPSLELRLPSDLPRRNRLELLVDPAKWPVHPAGAWGEVALVIRPSATGAIGGRERGSL